jgi:hypothetical protein
MILDECGVMAEQDENNRDEAHSWDARTERFLMRSGARSAFERQRANAAY